MPATFALAVITPAEVKFEGTAEIVIAPGAAGDIGALANHAPMLTTLRIGVLRATVEGARRIEYAINAGFMQVLPDKVLVLTDLALSSSEIDVEKTRAELRTAEESLAGKRGADDIAEREAVTWANAKLEAAHRPGV
ncbi:MAG: ATP synthase F1 subunit epsilon [Candidatus Eremiobacterales bacterium]|jgi:F-type H+-transporting ATPase subunit epsilon